MTLTLNQNLFIKLTVQVLQDVVFSNGSYFMFELRGQFFIQKTPFDASFSERIDDLLFLNVFGKMLLLYDCMTNIQNDE